MKLPTEISSFLYPWDFLSNFYACKVLLDEVEYPSIEHAYQAAKTLDMKQREIFNFAGFTAGQAKRKGAHLKLREDWTDELKISIMRDLLMQKFYPTILRRKLLSTFTATLIEGNNWHDTFWGVCNGTCRTSHEPFGDNHLGKLLMEVRDYYGLKNRIIPLT